MNNLSEYEKQLVESFENNEWEATPNLREDKKRYGLYAKNTMLKNKRINIRISERDLTKLKSRSFEEGMPYQTLISSILHKYISGRLVEQNG